MKTVIKLIVITILIAPSVYAKTKALRLVGTVDQVEAMESAVSLDFTGKVSLGVFDHWTVEKVPVRLLFEYPMTTYEMRKFKLSDPKFKEYNEKPMPFMLDLTEEQALKDLRGFESSGREVEIHVDMSRYEIEFESPENRKAIKRIKGPIQMIFDHHDIMK